MATTDRPGVADFYERDVLPALSAQLDHAFPEFGWKRDPRGWHATNHAFTHAIARRPRRPRRLPRRRATRLPHPRRRPSALDHLRQPGRRPGSRPRLRRRRPPPRRTRRRRRAPSTGHRPPPSGARVSSRTRSCSLATNCSATAAPPPAPTSATRHPRRAHRARPAWASMPDPPSAPTGARRQAYSERGDPRVRLSDTRWPVASSAPGATTAHRIVTTLWARTTEPDDRPSLPLPARRTPRAGIPYGLSDLLAAQRAHGSVASCCSSRASSTSISSAHTASDRRRARRHRRSRHLFERSPTSASSASSSPSTTTPPATPPPPAPSTPLHADHSPSVWIIDPDLYDTAKDPGELIHTDGANGVAQRLHRTRLRASPGAHSTSPAHSRASTTTSPAGRARDRRAMARRTPTPPRHRTNRRPQPPRRHPRLRRLRRATQLPRPLLARPSNNLIARPCRACTGPTSVLTSRDLLVHGPRPRRQRVTGDRPSSTADC